MNKDEAMKLARQAGWRESFTPPVALYRFAALVIKPWADQLEVERKKFKELNDVAALGMQHARADEREACAKICEDLHPGLATRVAAEYIRARGQA